jgi:hypothetical protein
MRPHLVVYDSVPVVPTHGYKQLLGAHVCNCGLVRRQAVLTLLSMIVRRSLCPHTVPTHCYKQLLDFYKQLQPLSTLSPCCL